MNSFLKLVFIFSLAVGSSAMAAEATQSVWKTQSLDFTYSSTRNYYSCYYAQNAAEQFLAQLGAKDVEVVCHGGIPYQPYVGLQATFSVVTPTLISKVIQPTTATYQTVVLKGSDSCEFNSKLISELVKSFSVKSVNHSGMCDFNGQGRFHFEVEVLK